MPCKGIEPGLELNIEAMMKQDYANYFGIVVTDTAQDPAYTIANSVIDRNSKAIARTQVSEAHVAASG